MTSVSSVSRSFNAACGRMTGGGASMVCGPFFAFCCWDLVELKKLPKKLGSSFFMSTSRSLLLFSCAADTFPPLGSGVAGLFAFKRSVTIAMAFEE